MKIKFVCLSKHSKEDGTVSSSYIAVIGLSEMPSEIWKQYFYFKCRRGTLIRKNSIKLNQDEIILKIEKGRNIQDYIESIKSIISATNLSVEKYFDNFDEINSDNI